MTKKEIGRVVAKARKEKQLSYYHIKKVSGVQRGVVQSIEKADSSYTIDSLLGVLSAIKITIHTDCSN